MIAAIVSSVVVAVVLALAGLHGEQVDEQPQREYVDPSTVTWERIRP